MPEKFEKKQPTQEVKGNGLDHESIRNRAYERYIERGMEDGHDVEDWLRAEEEISSGSEKSMAAAA